MIIGLQTFTVRKIFQKESDIINTLTFLKSIGINYIELAYIPFNLQFITMLKKHLDDFGIQVISSQLKMKTIEADFDIIIKIHQLLNIKYMAVSVMPFKRLLFGERGLKTLANELNILGKRTKEEGIQLMFHHHNYEFIKFKNRLAFDLLLENLNPEYVQILSDTYWVKKGGFNHLEFFKKYAAFIKALHLRGYKNNTDNNLKDSDIDIKEIIDYAIKHQFYYGVIEQNSNDPLPQIEKSVSQIKQDGFISHLGGK